MIRRTRFALCAAILFLVQTTVAHRFSHEFLRCDLLCVAAMYLALEAEFADAMWGGFALGMLRDLGSSGQVGASALVFVLATTGVLFLRGHLLRDSFLTDLVLTFAYALWCGTVMALGTGLLTPGAQVGALLQRGFGQAAFTTAVSPLLYLLFARVGLVDKSLASVR